jgi:hypothetical protein
VQLFKNTYKNNISKVFVKNADKKLTVRRAFPVDPIFIHSLVEIVIMKRFFLFATSSLAVLALNSGCVKAENDAETARKTASKPVPNPSPEPTVTPDPSPGFLCSPVRTEEGGFYPTPESLPQNGESSKGAILVGLSRTDIANSKSSSVGMLQPLAHWGDLDAECNNAGNTLFQSDKDDETGPLGRVYYHSGIYQGGKKRLDLHLAIKKEGTKLNAYLSGFRNNRKENIFIGEAKFCGKGAKANADIYRILPQNACVIQYQVVPGPKARREQKVAVGGGYIWIK